MRTRKIIGYTRTGLPIYLIGGADGPPDHEQLLKIVEALDPEKRQKEESAPSDSELVSAREGLALALKAAVEGDEPDLESARAIRAAIDRIDQEQVTRKEAREEARKEARALLDGLTPEPKPEGEPKAEGEPKPEGDEGEPKGEEKKEPALVASLADAIRRSERRRVQQVTEPEPGDVLVASVGPAQGRQLGPESTLRDAANVFTQYAPQVKRGSAVLIHMEKMYPQERQLGLSAEENTRLIDSIMSPRAITAAGGICEPLAADFTHPICGDRGRPIRDSLPSFRADRGGIRFAPSATVADMVPAITVWDVDTDETPGTATKACPRVECEDEETARVDAIVACLTVGNFQARFNPEFWRSRLDLLMVAHDRIAEQTLYASILAGSTLTLTYAPTLGTVVDVLQVVDKAAAGIRSRHRLIGGRLRTIMPAWVRDAMRAQLASQAPAGSLDLFAVADAQLNSFFTTRMIDPVWTPDVDTFSAQAGATALEDFGTTFNLVIYPEGTWMFLDGGTLDLGTNITDSTLNAVNDRQAFMETFEQVVFRGCESLAIPVAVGEECICSSVLTL